MGKKPGKKPLPPETRFWNHIVTEPNSGCWLWISNTTDRGYGLFNLYDVVLRKWTIVYAHRFSYEMYKGFIPIGLEVDHLCRVTCCVNPFHLEAVTHKVNVLRGDGLSAQSARQTHCKRGHELSGNNLYINPQSSSHRRCRACAKTNARDRYLIKCSKGKVPNAEHLI